MRRPFVIGLVALGLAGCSSSEPTSVTSVATVPMTSAPATTVLLNDALVDGIIRVIEANGMTVDRACLVRVLEQQDLASLAANPTPDPAFLQAALPCLSS